MTSLPFISSSVRISSFLFDFFFYSWFNYINFFFNDISYLFENQSYPERGKERKRRKEEEREHLLSAASFSNGLDQAEAWKLEPHPVCP